jgi:NADH-quinone oxidoreductase subunit N
VAVVQERARDDKLSAFAGLSRREPLLACCLMIFLLSLAGIPPLAGFVGKFFLFKAALFTKVPGAQPNELLWLVILAVAMSAVSLYYYLQVLKQVFVVAAPVDAPTLAPRRATRVAVALLAAAVLGLGCLPNLLLGPLMASILAAPL